MVQKFAVEEVSHRFFSILIPEYNQWNTPLPCNRFVYSTAFF